MQRSSNEVLVVKWHGNYPGIVQSLRASEPNSHCPCGRIELTFHVTIFIRFCPFPLAVARGSIASSRNGATAESRSASATTGWIRCPTETCWPIPNSPVPPSLGSHIQQGRAHTKARPMPRSDEYPGQVRLSAVMCRVAGGRGPVARKTRLRDRPRAERDQYSRHGFPVRFPLHHQAGLRNKRSVSPIAHEYAKCTVQRPLSELYRQGWQTAAPDGTRRPAAAATAPSRPQSLDESPTHRQSGCRKRGGRMTSSRTAW